MYRSEHDPDLHRLRWKKWRGVWSINGPRKRTGPERLGCASPTNEYAAITAAYCSGDPVAHFEATDKAIRRVLADLAEREAEPALERRQCQERRRHEEDRAADRAEFRRAFVRTASR